ncbi:tetratricopeptide repeat protein [candidate division CSSED10-310 bacterium]|uniref:Tetratricopeptide repeat protein n=1 Tax=candidate division CSSED10-310 bacterium TaxID=2855610 RepID=A0ABV6Z0S3_UNCC1
MEYPEQIGLYKILELLGQGGMGVVFLAQHVDTGEEVALKTVRVPNKSIVNSIRLEILALASIHHPGIVRIVDEGLHQGIPWYAMELLRGKTLSDWFKTQTERSRTEDFQNNEVTKQRFTTLHEIATENAWWTQSLEPGLEKSHTSTFDAIVPQNHLKETAPVSEQKPTLTSQDLLTILTLIRRLCSPLAFMHGQGIVHRDLKPENILIRADGRPVIVDFGLMTRFSGEVSRDALSYIRNVSGTVSYMAPEQIQGKIVDARADLYALGCILHVLLTGFPPFLERTQAQVLQAHLNREPLPPSHLMNGIPSEVDELTLRLLAKNPVDRLGYADVVASLLARLGAANDLFTDTFSPGFYLYRAELAGRQKQLSSLLDFLDQQISGQGNFVVVGGESGVGKTRLVLELARAAYQREMLVLTGECLDRGGRPLEVLLKPLQAIVDRCRELGQEESDRIFGQRGKVLASYEPSISKLPGQETYSEPITLPPQAAKLRLFRSLADVFKLLAEQTHPLLILDDLQWADDLSREFLEFLQRGNQLAEISFLIIGTYRSEEIHEPLKQLIKGQKVSHILLSRLDEAGVTTIISDMLAMPTPPEMFCEYLSRHSEGNPFFVGEYLRTAVAEGILHRDNEGDWHISGLDENKATAAELESLSMPRSIVDLIDRRIQGLPPAVHRVTKIAAVIGHDFSIKLLHESSEMDERMILETVKDLIHRHVLEENQSGILNFAHDKIREVAYSWIKPDEEGDLHRAAAECIEKLCHENIDEYLARLARHWEIAGEKAKAQDRYLAAAKQAKSCYAHAQAEKFYRAYLCLTDIPTPDTIQVRNELARDILAHTGRMDLALSEHTIALSEARAIQNEQVEATSLFGQGEIFWKTGRIEKALQSFHDSLTIFHQIGMKNEECKVFNSLASLHRELGNLQESWDFYKKALTLARESGDRDSEAIVLGGMSVFYGEQGKLEQARSLLDQVLDIFRETGNRIMEGVALGNLANVHHGLGRLAESRYFLEQNLAIAREVGFRVSEGVVLGNLALLATEQGRLTEAKKLLLQALDIHRELENRKEEGIVLGNMGSLHSSQKDWLAAQNFFEQALLILREVGSRRFEAKVLGGLGLVKLNLGFIDEATKHFDQAFDLNCELKNRQFQGEILLYRARLARLAGNLEQAIHLNGEALTIFEETADRHSLALALCERGFCLICQNHSAGSDLKEAQDIAISLKVGEHSDLSQTLSNLKSAQEAQTSSNYQKLFQGELILNIPPGLRLWLVEKDVLNRVQAQLPQRKDVDR